MASIKKRKRDVSSANPSLSAFAARRALTDDARRPKRLDNSIDGEVLIETENETGPAGLKPKNLEVLVKVETIPKKNPRNKTAELDPNGSLSEVDEDNRRSLSRVESIEVPAQRPSIAFSTYKPNKENFKELVGGVISLRIAPGERLVILGQCEIRIVQGEVTLLGTILRPSQEFHRLYASSSHSLPVIRCLATDINHAEILLRQYESGLSSLQYLSPLFGKLWNEGSSSLGSGYDNFLQKPGSSTFRILFSSSSNPSRLYLQPLISPPEWNAVLARCSVSSGSKPRVTFVCGPKSSGKSTFAKLLGNRLISSSGALSTQKKVKKLYGVAVLDLDPGQPEYSPPGQVALMHIQQPNFGPPFSHPAPDSPNILLRSHSISAISPARDPSLYMACALDLFAHYCSLLSINPHCPLIINTPGWVLGTGLEILVKLIEKIQPSEIIYMSQDGPLEVVESLQDAAKSIPFITLPSQTSEYTTRTAAHLRTMQCMSYFHLDTVQEGKLAWNGRPLATVPPWEIIYSGEPAGILGIVCYGEQTPPSLLAAAINGSLVSVVVIEDGSTIPGWNSDTMGNEQTRCRMGFTKDNDTNDQVLDNKFLLNGNQQPMIIRTPDEDLPYFNPANDICLDPSNSYCVGLALIRGIDVVRRRIQVLTPISQSIIEEARQAGKMIVLVSGKLDTPGWAYTEQLLQKFMKEKNSSNEDDDSMLVDEEATSTTNIEESESEDILTEQAEIDDRIQDIPWIEKIEGSQGRKIGSRVWRIRRDLGKFNDGGD